MKRGRKGKHRGSAVTRAVRTIMKALRHGGHGHGRRHDEARHRGRRRSHHDESRHHGRRRRDESRDRHHGGWRDDRAGHKRAARKGWRGRHDESRRRRRKH